jgi:streptomycin 6-kinase
VIQVPAGLAGRRDLGPLWADWLDRLPRLHREVMAEWQLAPDGEVMHGFCSMVTPVRTAAGTAAVLKIGLPDDESEHEALALQHWAGDGAVRLLRADPHRRAMLLERLQRRDLNTVPDVQACRVVAERYARLHRPAPPQLRRLTGYLSGWAAELAELPRQAAVPRRLVEQALSLSRDLVTDPASDGVMIHTDLHYENVLAGQREDWLVIDPKPVSGDPHYELSPMLWNRLDELSGDVRAGIRRRFQVLVDEAGLDADRARDWVIVRVVLNAMWRLQGAPSDGWRIPADTWLTGCVSIAKAVQD